jgi:hypothetical protein
MNAAGVAADTRVNIGPRPVPQEPMVRVIVYYMLSIHMSDGSLIPST